MAVIHDIYSMHCVTAILSMKKNINVWSPGEVYPTVRLLYTYNGTLKVRVTNTTPTSVIEELEREGFCGGEAVSGVIYYIKSVDECGEICLYQ